jgi:hypothetical protein
MATASEKFIVDARAIAWIGARVLHPNIPAGHLLDFSPMQEMGIRGSFK